MPYFSDPAEIVEGGITRIKIRYSSAAGDGHQGSAYLLFPRGYEGGGSYPAAIVMHGHEDGAKDAIARDWTAAHRAAALYLAEQGVIVIAPDTPSFGEAPVPEEQICAANGRASLGCHNSIEWPLGRLPQTYFIDDLTDVGILIAQPGVDRSRVFSVGLSLGSYQSTLLGALDTRVTGGTMAGDLFLAFACLNDPSQNHACQTIPGLINVAVDAGQMSQTTNDSSHRLLEMEDLAALIAPRRLMITWGTADSFWTGSQGSCAHSALANAQAIWQRLNLGPLTPNFVNAMPHELDDASAFDLIFGPPAPIRRDYGTQCNNMHCCLPGEAMIGVHVDHNQFLCTPLVRTPANEVCAVDSGTQRSGMHACSVGRYMKGLHVGNNQLTCCFDGSRGQPPLANESIDGGTQLEDMHGCFAAGGQARLMTGIHVGHNQLLCADRF